MIGISYWPLVALALVVSTCIMIPIALAWDRPKKRKDRAATRPKQFENRFFYRIEPVQKSQEGAADLRPLGREDFR